MGTNAGKKMVLKISASLDDNEKFDLKLANIADFRKHLEEAVNTYCFSNVLCVIPTSFANNRTVTLTANLLLEPNQHPLNLVIDFAQ